MADEKRGAQPPRGGKTGEGNRGAPGGGQDRRSGPGGGGPGGGPGRGGPGGPGRGGDKNRKGGFARGAQAKPARAELYESLKELTRGDGFRIDKFVAAEKGTHRPVKTEYRLTREGLKGVHIFQRLVDAQAAAIAPLPEPEPEPEPTPEIEAVAPEADPTPEPESVTQSEAVPEPEGAVETPPEPGA
jgi:hypothetical protein